MPRKEKPEITVQISSIRQLSAELLSMRPACLYLPLSEAFNNREKMRAVCHAGITVAVALPRVINDTESGAVLDELSAVRELGVGQALIYNIGHMEYAASMGYSVRGDFYCTNSQALKEYKQKGVLSVLLSMELDLEAVKELSHGIDTELMLYGRMPMLLSERCLMKTPSGLCRCDSPMELVDKQGLRCPIVRESGHRNLIYSPSKLWMEPHRDLWTGIGLWAGRLVFTTENNREVIQVAERFMGGGKYVPNQSTTGFYIKEEGQPQKRSPARKLFFS